MKKKATKKKAKPKAAKKMNGKHTDTKSHNVNIRVISGQKQKISPAVKKNLAVLAKAHQIIWRGLNSDYRQLKGAEKIGGARVALLNIIEQNGFTLSESGKLIKTIQ